MIEQRFRTMLLIHHDALESKQLFSGLLKDYFPKEPVIVDLMTLLHDMGIHTEIEKARRVTKDFANKFAKRLMDGHGTDRRYAKYVVRLFCLGYGAGILGKPCDLGKADAKSTAGGADPQAADNAQGPAGAPPGLTEGQNWRYYVPPDPPGIPVNYIAEKYAENPVAANMLFQGKRLKLTGTIMAIKQIRGDMSVHLEGRGFRNPEAFFAASEQKAIAQLKKGQEIEFMGSIEGINVWHDLQIKDCEIL